MKKNNQKNNLLIKKRLIYEIRKSGIKRINPNSFIFLDAYFLEKLKEILKDAKEELSIHGRKTIASRDIKKALNTSQKEESFEV